MEIIHESGIAVEEFQFHQMLNALVKEDGKRKVTMGKGIIKPGARIPLAGMAAHKGDEFSYIIKGTMISGTADLTTTVTGGDYSFIPKGQNHWCANESQETCELIWVLIGDN